MQDTEDLTLGMWIDYVIEWNNMNGRDEEEVTTSKSGKVEKKGKRRAATQTDFDNF